MKNKPLSIIGTFIFLLVLLFTVACKKTSEPQNPQLIGNWLQITNQDTVYFYVDDVGGTLYITKMKVSVDYQTGYIRYSISSTSGLAPIDENNHFNLIIEEGGQEGPTYIDGTFNPSTLVLMGNFAYYITGQSSRINYPYTIQRP